MTDRVVISRPIVGLAHMQVCAVDDATDDEILAACNRLNRSGTTNGWTTVHRSADEFWGDVAPVACHDHVGRMHFIVGC